MIRLSRLADYGVVLMTRIAASGQRVHSANNLSADLGLPLPTVSKLLSAFARSGLLVATRGAKGGYRLACDPHRVSVASIVTAVDGPIALTQCIERGPGSCEVEGFCPSRRGWVIINDAVRGAFEQVSLADLMPAPAIARPVPVTGPVHTAAGN